MILSMIAYGDKSSLLFQKGDELSFDQGVTKSISLFLKTASDILSVFDINGAIVGSEGSSLRKAAIDLVIGAESSEGSTPDVIDDMTVTSLLSKVRTRSFLVGSRSIPRRRAELSDRCTAAHD